MWNGCVFHELDALHGYDEHPVRQVNLEMVANEKFFQSGGRSQRINFRCLEFKTLRRPISEVNGDCGRNSLVHGQYPFLLVGFHNSPASLCSHRAVWPAVRWPRVAFWSGGQRNLPVEEGSGPRETEGMPSNRRSASIDAREDWPSLTCSCGN